MEQVVIKKPFQRKKKINYLEDFMKNLKLFVSLISILSVVALAVGCGNKTTAQVSETAQETAQAATKKFIVGFDAEYPPYGYITESGTYEGFDLDLAQEFCNRKGYEFVAQPIDWDSKDLELNSGNIDCIWNGFTVTGRENDYTWTVPYVDNSIVLVVKADSNINAKADLAGKVVMAQAGSSALTALEDESDEETFALAKSFKSLEQCPDYNNGFMSLESGMVDCLAVDIGVAKYQLNNSKGLFKQLPENLSSEQYAIGFKKGNTALKDEVQSVVFDMYKDGTFMKIANKYSDFSLPDMVCLGEYVK